MKLVKNLLLGALVLFITNSCVPKYTCKEAPLHCASCRTIELSYKPVPANILFREYPGECKLTLDQFEYILIKKSEDPVLDMQKMVSEYRRVTDYLSNLERLKQACLAKIKQQKADIIKDSVNYCKKFKMVYDPDRAVCVPDTETESE